MAQGNNMMEEINNSMNAVILKQIEDFKNSSELSSIFPMSLNKCQRNFIHKISKENLIHSKTLYKDGGKYVKIYKNEFNDSKTDIPTFYLHEESQKESYKFLKMCSNLKFNQEDLKRRGTYVRIQPYRLIGISFDTVTKTIPPMRSNLVQSNLPILKRKAQILQHIENNQILIVTSHSSFGRSTNVANFILEKAAVCKNSCKIICVQSNRISAVGNSYQLAQERGERLGTTIGYQVRLEGMSSSYTNILHTTAWFIMRCLLGQNGKDIFNHITHLIIDDAHEKDPYKDLLLFEIKEILKTNISMKVIIYSGPTDIKLLRSYLPQSVYLNLETDINSQLYFLEEIIIITGYNRKYCFENTSTYISTEYQKIFDEYLEECYLKGTPASFEKLFLLYKNEKFCVNRQHSKLGMTGLMAAAYHDRLYYIIEFLQMNANLFIKDYNGKTAIIWANEANSVASSFHLDEVIKMKKKQNDKFRLEDFLTEHEDFLENNITNHNLVFETIKYICAEKIIGNILVFLPTYDEIQIQKKLLLNNFKELDLNNKLKIMVAHELMMISDYKVIASPSNEIKKIILTTEIGEGSLLFPDIQYVIDSGKRCERVWNYLEGLTEMKIKWISKYAATRRASIVGTGKCFRLYSRRQHELFLNSDAIQIFNISLNKICLFAKCLAPDISIINFFSQLIHKPNPEIIENSCNLLKSINALDKLENITCLGIKLIDIPVDVQLGKSLIFSTILKCLDPVLTIVSALSYRDPWNITDDYLNKQKIMLSKKTLAEGTNSDHLILLRGFQKWQDSKINENDNLFADQFFSNYTFEIVCVIRAQIVGSLRACGLIQSIGPLNMQSINTNSNKWSVIKACLVGGLYPNICKIDRKTYHLQTDFSKKIVPSSKSIMANLNQTFDMENKDSYQTDWIIYSQNCDIGPYSIIENNTMITPVSIALFAGNMTMSELNLESLSADESDSDSENISETLKNTMVRYYINDWLYFTLNSTDAYLLLGIRKQFFTLFCDVLNKIDEPERIRKQRGLVDSKFSIISSIVEILSVEDITNNIPQPERVGDRPRAFQNNNGINHNYEIAENIININN